MKLKKYESIISKIKKYKSIFKEQEISVEETPLGVPRPQFEEKVKEKIRLANDNISISRDEEDWDQVNFWENYKIYMESYLENPDFGNAKKLSKQKAGDNVDNRGDVQAAIDIMNLYGGGNQENWED